MDEQEEIQQQCETPEEVKDAAPVTKKKRDGLGLAFAIVCLVLQIVGIIVFLYGICRPFNKDLGIIGAVEFFISLFRIKTANIYETISKVMLSVFYIVVLVFLVKNTVSISCSLAKLKSESKGGDESQNAVVNEKVKISLRNQILNDIYRKAADGYFKMLLLISLSYMLSGNELTWASYLTVALACALYLVARVLWSLRGKLPRLHEKRGISDLVLSLIRPALFVVAFLFLGLVTIQPVGENLAFGIQAVFNGCFGSGTVGVITTLYDKIVLHILDTILIVYYLCALHFILNYDGQDTGASRYERYRRLNKTTIKYLSVAIVSLVVAFIFPLLSLGTVGSIAPSDVTRALVTVLRSRFFAAVLISVAITVICTVSKSS